MESGISECLDEEVVFCEDDIEDSSKFSTCSRPEQEISNFWLQ